MVTLNRKLFENCDCPFLCKTILVKMIETYNSGKGNWNESVSMPDVKRVPTVRRRNGAIIPGHDTFTIAKSMT